MYKILIVEDDLQSARSLEQVLENWGYEARRVQDFENVLAEFDAFMPDLVLMDLYLPGRNGFYWTDRIRTISGVPVIFISSADENMNIVTALGKGADAYVTKPFDTTVLISKIQALLRRTYDYSPAARYLEHRGLRVYPVSFQAGYLDHTIELTRNELKILTVLLAHKGEVVSREELMEALWQTDCYIDENTLTVNVSRLRSKLSQIGAENYVHTVRGVGYRV